MDSSQNDVNRPKLIKSPIILKKEGDHYFIYAEPNNALSPTAKIYIKYRYKAVNSMMVSHQLTLTENPLDKKIVYKSAGIQEEYTPLISKENSNICVEYIVPGSIQKETYYIIEIKNYFRYEWLLILGNEVSDQGKLIPKRDICPISKIELYTYDNGTGTLQLYLTKSYLNNQICRVKYRGIWGKTDQIHDYVILNLKEMSLRPGPSKEDCVFITIQRDGDKERKFYMWRNTKTYGNPERLEIEEVIEDGVKKLIDSFEPDANSSRIKSFANQGSSLPSQFITKSQSELNEKKAMEVLKNNLWEFEKKIKQLKLENTQLRDSEGQNEKRIKQLLEKENENNKLIDKYKQVQETLNNDLDIKEHEKQQLIKEKEDLGNKLSEYQRKIKERENIYILIEQLAKDHDIVFWTDILKKIKGMENYNRKIQEDFALYKNSEDFKDLFGFQSISKWYFENGKKWLENTYYALGSDGSYEREYGINTEKLEDLKSCIELVDVLFINYKSMITKIVMDSNSDEEIKEKIKDETVRLLKENDTKETLECLAKAIYKCRSAIMRPISIYNLSFYLFNLFNIYDDIKTGQEAF